MSLAEVLSQIRTAGDAPNLPVPECWNPEYVLYPFQRVGVAHLSTQKVFILGDPVGAGKTIQELFAWVLCSQNRQNKGLPPLSLWVITPKSVVKQWQEEILRFIPKANVFALRSKSQVSLNKHQRLQIFEEFVNTPGSVLISNWAQMVLNWEVFKERYGVDWLCNTQVTFDEAQKLGNPGTKTHKIGGEIIALADRAHGLTATLAKNRAHNAQAVVSAFVPELCSLQVFESLYCEYGKELTYYLRGRNGRTTYHPQGVWVKKFLKYKNLEEYRERISPIFLGRMDTEIGKTRPQISLLVRTCEIGLNHREVYQKVEAGLLDKDMEEKDVAPILSQAQQILNSPKKEYSENNPKYDLLLDVLREDIVDEQVICYCPYSDTIDAYYEQLCKDQFSCARITGKDSEKSRELAKSQFLAGERQIILLTDAGGEGLNLQVAKHLIFISRPWSPGQYTQVVGRARRFGSNHSFICVWHLSCEDSLDEYVDSVLTAKFGSLSNLASRGEMSLTDSEVSPIDIARELFKTRVKATRLKQIQEF